MSFSLIIVSAVISGDQTEVASFLFYLFIFFQVFYFKFNHFILLGINKTFVSTLGLMEGLMDNSINPVIAVSIIYLSYNPSVVCSTGELCGRMVVVL